MYDYLGVKSNEKDYALWDPHMNAEDTRQSCEMSLNAYIYVKEGKY